MNNANNEPAFPHEFRYGDGTVQRCEGMTLRQYAAIKLKVPNSGTDWLDEMILEAKRDEIEARWIQGCASNPNATDKSRDIATKFVQRFADAIAKATGANHE